MPGDPISPTDDDALLARARAGDATAFRSLVERHESVVAGVVIGMLGRGDDADDVGQEVFIRFHDALHRFRGDAQLGTYLRRIAMNLSLNALKRRRRFSLRLVSRDQAMAPLPEPPVPALDLEAVERRELVHSSVARLSEKQRSVVVLRILDGLSTNETAAVLQVPSGTVMSRLSRGLAELETMLEPYMRGGARGA
jgi:RNA polymerase sigma-70 factor (ECF subfamily)